MFLGAVFLYACFSKIVHPDQFAKIVFGYGLFPDFSINLIAVLIPWMELFAAGLYVLFFDKKRVLSLERPSEFFIENSNR